MDKDTEYGLSCLFYIGLAVVLLVVIVGGIIGGFKSLTNLIRYGQFTTNTTVAMVDAHLNDPNYFSQLAAQAQISVVSSHISTTDGTGQWSNQGVTVMLTFKNSSNNAHAIAISDAKVLMVVNGQPQTMELGCDAGAGDFFTIPAGGTVQAGQSFCGGYGAGTVTGQARLIEKPHVLEIDGLPISGGPQNTPWKCLAPETNLNDVVFTNNC